jgi:DNA-binding transcriptional LysR family regulator
MARTSLHRRFDLISLNLFLAVAEEQSLTRAARREHMVLSAVSKRIADLEAAAGTLLVERHARGVTLTAAGKSLAHHARQVMLTLHRMDGELGEHERGIRGRVRLHAIASALLEFLPEDLHRFLKANPGIRIDLQEQTGQDIVEALVEGAADVGVIAEHTPAPGLTCIPYRTDRLVLVVPRGHPFERRRSVRLRDALSFDFVAPHIASSINAVVMRAAAEAGRAIKLRVQVRSFDVMCRMIQAGLGVGVLPERAIQAQIKANEVRCVPLKERWASRELQICVREAVRLPVVADRLVAHLSGPH